MKQLNKCPNCGATIGKMVSGIMRCEYCDSEFLSPYPPHIEIPMPTAEETVEMLKQIDRTVHIAEHNGISETIELIPNIRLDAGHIMKARY